MGDWQITGESAATESWALAGWWFLRLLGLVYLAAFASLALQIRGLVGRAGILPASEFLRGYRRHGWRRFLQVPTLFWFGVSDAALLASCWGGALLSVLLIVGYAQLPALILLWMFYLSLFHVAQIFLCYQWDLLLLEAGFLAIFLAPPEVVASFPPTTQPPTVVIWLYWWLLFRLMLGSGLVKWLSGDRSWRQLTALRDHFETQPLPTWVAWWARQLPTSLLKLSAIVVLIIELIFPFLSFGPASWRNAAALAFVCLMVSIQLTGNYGFFNLLGMALATLLLNDHTLSALFGWLWDRPVLATELRPRPAGVHWSAMVAAAVVAVMSVAKLMFRFRKPMNCPEWIRECIHRLEPFRLVNRYGLFAVMTTGRKEIIIEGSHDGVTWHEYEFKWKPGDPKRPPGFVAPHMPRLDWQMWFAAQEPHSRLVWFDRFLYRLKTGSPVVLALLRRSPFAQPPPRLIRWRVAGYHFTALAGRRATGNWWERTWRTGD